MISLPNRNETVALIAVWVIWPALWLAETAAFARISELNGSLPLPLRWTMVVVASNAYCVPSLVGTAILVAIARLSKNQDLLRFGCHILTLAAFVFVVIVMAGFHSLIYVK